MQSVDIYLLVTVLMVLCFVLLIMTLSLMISLSKLRKRFKTIFNRTNTQESLQEVLENYYLHVRNVDEQYGNLVRNVDELYDKVKPCMQKVGVVRYNPFEDMGGDLSYALAILDEENNGFILNTIMTRESCRTYCKPISNSISDYPLSHEEELCIKRATGTDKSIPRSQRARGL